VRSPRVSHRPRAASWISEVPGLRFGYEEALGYCCDPDVVNDKDGITASLLMLEMVAALKAEGRGVQDVLDDLARKFGLYAAISETRTESWLVPGRRRDGSPSC